MRTDACRTIVAQMMGPADRESAGYKSTLGGKAVLNAIREWEKRNGHFCTMKQKNEIIKNNKKK